MTDDFFIAVIHPSPAANLMRPLTLRELWEQYTHEVRWERRYGRPYPHVKGELGTW